MSNDERSRLNDVYSDYESAEVQQRWDRTNPGNAQIVAEQFRVVTELLAAAGISSADRVLDLGAGSASTIPQLDAFRSGSTLVSLDLLETRVRQAAEVAEHDVYVVGDGTALPFVSRSFQVVSLFTVLSSILDPALGQHLCSEVDRVLAPGGAVVFYDMRVANRSNPNLRHLSRREWTTLFPGYAAHVRSLTVAPPLARRLGGATETLYPQIARLPMVRSHLAGVLVKPTRR